MSSRALSHIRKILARRKAGKAVGRAAQPVLIDPVSEGPEVPVKLNEITGFFPQEIGENPDIWPVDRPFVSVVIPCFNYGDFVAEAVDSVLAQTFQDLEIIVVEGGSTSLKSRQQVANLSRPKTRVVFQSQQHFTGANRNFGISQAKGKYICCLDADDCLHPTYIEKALFLLEHYGYDVVSTALQYFGNRSEVIGIIETPDLAALLEGNHVLTCAVFRRSLWEDAGGFRDTDRAVTGYVFEDWSFWVRLAGLGAKFINIAGEALFLYRSHGLSISTQPNLLSLERQARIISKINADVVGPAMIERSSQVATESRREADGVRNLARRPQRLPDRRRVLLIALPFTIIGGAERLLSTVAAHLTSVGWRVIITTSIDPGTEHGDSTDWFRRSTEEIYHLPRFLARDRWDDFVHYLCRVKDVSAILIAGSAYFYEILPIIKAAYPHIAIADLLFNTSGHTENNRRRANYIALNIVENREVLDWMIAKGESPARIELIESGIDLEKHRPGPRDSTIMAQLNVPPTNLIVGFSGRWSAEKDPLGFIEIARRVAPDVPATFVMTGTGHMRPAIEEAISRAKFLPGRFCLAGSVSDVASYIRSYDMLVLPSQLDGRPFVVLEALAMGVPVIASRVGALPELIDDGKNGYLCNPGDYDAFAARITSLAASRSALMGKKRAARASAERRLCATEMLRKYAARLERLTSSKADREDHSLPRAAVGDDPTRTPVDRDGWMPCGQPTGIRPR